MVSVSDGSGVVVTGSVVDEVVVVGASVVVVVGASVVVVAGGAVVVVVGAPVVVVVGGAVVVVVGGAVVEVDTIAVVTDVDGGGTVVVVTSAVVVVVSGAAVVEVVRLIDGRLIDEGIDGRDDELPHAASATANATIASSANQQPEQRTRLMGGSLAPGPTGTGASARPGVRATRPTTVRPVPHPTREFPPCSSW